MVHYILQTIVFQLLFLVAYELFLKKETFFNHNRVYLLCTAIISVILPVIKITVFKQIIQKQFVIALPEVFLTNTTSNTAAPIITFIDEVTPKALSFHAILNLVLFIGMGVATLIFIYKLTTVFLLIRKSNKQKKENFTIVNLPNSKAAFSFFSYLFLGNEIKPQDKVHVLKHESIHIAQKHSYDLLYFELLRIVFWFNPLIYRYQKHITVLHEFIADNKAIKTTEKKAYYQSLLSQVFETKNVSFINTFYKQSLIKKRIVMLSKSKSNQNSKIKYTILIPLIFGMLLYTSCQSEAAAEKEDINLNKLTFSVPIQLGSGSNNRDDYRAFEYIEKEMVSVLKSNPDYVRWVKVNPRSIEFSVHSKQEERPEHYLNLKGFDGVDKGLSFYLSYVEALRNGNFTGSEDEEVIIEVQEIIFENIEKVPFGEAVEVEEVPFALIDESPIFIGCENLSEAERKQCFIEKIRTLISGNFNPELGKIQGLKGRQQINVIFKIDAEGNVSNIKTRAAHPNLEQEAKRVIQLLPKMKPGKQNGTAVMTSYSLPIILDVDDK